MISKEVTANGITTDEAIENGCEQLGVSRDQVKYEIIELPKQKTLGLFGGSPAVVRVYVESDPATEAKEYLESIIGAMGLDGIEIEIKYNEEGNGAELDLTGEGLGNVIGRHGETLAALQYLVSLSANSAGEDYYRITINIGNYREKHENSLENLARKTAARALKMNTNLALEYMNPYERRIVHTAVQEVEGATSWSVGEGTSRHVVIGPEGLNEGEDGLPVNKSRGYGRGGYGGRSYGRGGYNRSGYRNNRRYQNNRYHGGYRGGNRYYNDTENGDEQNNTGYARQGRYAGNHNYSTGYDRYDNNGRYRGGYKGGYGGEREENAEGGYENGYRRNSGYRGGGYNRGNSQRRSYSRNNESSVQNETREIRKDSSAPLYGRIEVKKPDTENGDE